MSDRPEGANEGEAQRNHGAQELEIDEALVRDAELESSSTNGSGIAKADPYSID